MAVAVDGSVVAPGSSRFDTVDVGEPLRVGAFLFVGASIASGADAVVYAGLVCALVSVVVLRIRRRTGSGRRPWLRSATLIAGVTIAAIAAGLLASRSAWPAAVVLAFWAMVEIVFWLPPFELSTRVPVSAVDWLLDACVAVLVGAFASPTVAATDALRLLALTVPAGAAIACAVAARAAAAYGRADSSQPPRRGLFLIAAVGASAAACAVALSGFATRLPVEHALFASMVGVLIVVLGYAGMIDPRPDDRVGRVATLLTVGMLAICYGNAVVLLIVGSR